MCAFIKKCFMYNLWSFLIFSKIHKIERRKNVSQAGLITHSSDYQASTLPLDHKSKGAPGSFTNIETCNLDLIMEPETLYPMPRNIFLLEPRIRSLYEHGLIRLFCVSKSPLPPPRQRLGPHTSSSCTE